MEDEIEIFVWADAWVFTALLYSTNQGSNLDLSRLIAAGDMINHSIFTREEVRNGLLKMQRLGILEVKDRRVYFSETGERMMADFEKKKGGLFPKIEALLSEMNRIGSRSYSDKNTVSLDFISEIEFEKAYERYFNRS